MPCPDCLFNWIENESRKGHLESRIMMSKPVYKSFIFFHFFCYTQCDPVIYLESELKEHLTVVKCMFKLILLISCTTYLEQITRLTTSYLQYWGFSTISKLGSSSNTKSGNVGMSPLLYTCLSLKKLPLPLWLILQANVNRSSRCLLLGFVFSNLVHEDEASI